MAEYIDRKAAIKAITPPPSTDFMIAAVMLEYGEAIAQIPAADVAPVVYCKDCVHLGFKDCYGVCEGGPVCGIVRPYDYCSHGVRKEKLKDKEADDGQTT